MEFGGGIRITHSGSRFLDQKNKVMLCESTNDKVTCPVSALFHKRGKPTHSDGISYPAPDAQRYIDPTHPRDKSVKAAHCREGEDPEGDH